MSANLRSQDIRNFDSSGLRWSFSEDQLHDAIGPLSKEAPKIFGVIYVGSYWKATRPPYHKRKFTLKPYVS